MKGTIIFSMESTMLKHVQNETPVLDATLEGAKQQLSLAR